MAKKIFIFLIILLIVFGLLTFYFKKLEEIKASPSSSHNVYGWAWTNFYPDIEAGVLKAASGWISFNCYNDYNNDGILESHCTDAGYPSDYGVHICESDADANCSHLSPSRAGKFVGHAWFGGGQDAAGNPTSTLGWISFDRNETGAPPGPPFNTSGDFIAKVDNVNPSICDTEGGASNDFLDTWCGGDNSTTPIGNYKQVFGWARVLAGTSTPGGWSGWIKLSKDPADGGASYGVTIDMTATPKEFKGWAWGGGGTAIANAVVGWISFNTTNYPGGADYKVITTLVINDPPTVSNASTTATHCGFAGAMKYHFSWTYNDDATNPTPMSRYDIKILDSNNNQIYFASTTDSWPPPPTTVGTSITVPDDGPQFGVNTYRWYVKVYDSQNADSGWVYGGTFTTPPHAYPYPDFAPFPAQPSIDEVVTFEQDGPPPAGAPEALCYPGGILCQNVATTTYNWNFGNGETSNYKGNATTTYAAIGSYTVSLTITDDVGCCSASRTINIALPLPKWKEIPPR